MEQATYLDFVLMAIHGFTTYGGFLLPNFLASWRLMGQATIDSAKYLPKFIKGNALLILAFVVPCELLHYFFALIQKMYASRGLPVWPPQVGLLFVSLLIFAFYILLVPLRVPEIEKQEQKPAPFWPFVFKHSWPLVLEGIRATAVCLLWLVGGILTALVLAFALQAMGIFDVQSAIASATQPSTSIQSQTNLLISIALALIAIGPFAFLYIRYIFVSYVVISDPDYEAGKVNPLKRSFALVKGLTLHIFLISMVAFAFETQRNTFREMAPWSAVPFEIINIYVNILLFQIYRLRVKAWN